MNPEAAPLFILSFRHRDELDRIAQGAGWQPVAARRIANAEARFIGSGAGVAVIDARGALAEGLEAARLLGDSAEANAAAMLVLVSRNDSEALDGFHAAGATHFLVSPFSDRQFVQAVQFAARHAERVGGSHRRSRRVEDDKPEPVTGHEQSHDAQAARRWIEDRIALGGGEPGIVLLLLAVNRFDAINAAFGRATGDAVLQAAARRIERLAGDDPKRRLVARLAGAEYAILLAAPTSLSEGRFLAGQLVESLGRPFMSGDHVITLGSRVGVAASASGDDAAALLRRASAALAEAKANEAGPIRVIEAGAQGDAARGDALEIDLRRALDRHEIEILFQPQVSVATGAIEGVEALARWRHPVHGELGAATLFGVAERSDYLVQLSDHVQRKAIAEAAAWPASLAHLRIAVNVTAEDIVRPGFAGQFLALAADSGLDPKRLTVEVTESGLIDDLGAAATLLASLREGGLRIAIDDFGTGYSSLAYLKALPLDYLKIDKRLCEDIAGSPRDRIVVRSVIDMARSLGLSVIAEGVESEAQLALLAQEGCDLYQGFLCAPPVDSAALAGLVAAQP